MAHAEGLEPPKVIKPRRFSGPFPHPAGLRAYGGQGGIRTLARLLAAYSLSRGAPSTTWVPAQKITFYLSF